MVKTVRRLKVSDADTPQSAQRVTQDRPPQYIPDFASGSWLYFERAELALVKE